MMLQQHFSLKKYNSFGIDVTAKYFAAFDSVTTLQAALEAYSNNILVLGGGSNILFTQHFDGLVLKNEIAGIERVKEDDDFVWVKAGAGVSWHAFVLYCIAHGLAGVENLSLIPGSVGASPMQNIGAYGVEIKDVFESLEAYHLHDKTMVTFNNAACAFGYRESVFKNKYKHQFVITTVTYRLRKQPIFNTSYGAIETALQTMGVTTLSIKAISDAVIGIRKSKLPDPQVIGNAGSFFKNPTVPTAQFESLKTTFPAIVGYKVDDQQTKLAAGWLIEQCGFKGYREGDAGCHAQQALVLVNYGHADGNAILQLSEKIIESVAQKFGVMLQREVNIV
ncbi:UDP-N-acetylmuramate dehydrogenase [Ferruginibacter yonginensis]|uniref:UDP-N-acetylenolpyruvoylglucosamine reductase n=1 Tax=Ferruginibacter yonginensis TaxID=1310416 RepID=A0ABV8QTW6_9BACT